MYLFVSNFFNYFKYLTMFLILFKIPGGCELGSQNASPMIFNDQSWLNILHIWRIIVNSVKRWEMIFEDHMFVEAGRFCSQALQIIRTPLRLENGLSPSDPAGTAKFLMDPSAPMLREGMMPGDDHTNSPTLQRTRRSKGPERSTPTSTLEPFLFPRSSFF